ncbi:Lysozyme RrrD [compost metagenome]
MINKATIDLIKKYEGLRLTAYLCPAKVWTIGYGTTFYPNGGKVKQGDIITQIQAEQYLSDIVERFSMQVRNVVKMSINENQLGALTSLAYNIGINAFNNSTLLKKVNINPNDPSIGIEFSRWNKGGGKVLTGLINRRHDEKELYFS